MSSSIKTAMKPVAAPRAVGGMGMMGKKPMKKYDRSAEDMGNMVELGHVNVTVPARCGIQRAEGHRAGHQAFL